MISSREMFSSCPSAALVVGDDRLGEALVFTHPFGELHAAKLAGAGGILAPGAAGEVAADNHLHGKSLAAVAYGDHRVGSGEAPVGHDVGGSFKKLRSYLVEHLTLEGDPLGEDYIESRDAVGGYHHQKIVGDGVDVAHFTMIHRGLAGEFVIGFY